MVWSFFPTLPEHTVKMQRVASAQRCSTLTNIPHCHKKRGFEETQTPTRTQNARSNLRPHPLLPRSPSANEGTHCWLAGETKKLWIKISPASIWDIYTHPSHTLKVQESWPLTDPALSATRDQNFKNGGTLPAYVHQPQTPLNNLREKMMEYKLENINCPNEVQFLSLLKICRMFYF